MFDDRSENYIHSDNCRDTSSIQNIDESRVSNFLKVMIGNQCRPVE